MRVTYQKNQVIITKFSSAKKTKGKMLLWLLLKTLSAHDVTGNIPVSAAVVRIAERAESDAENIPKIQTMQEGKC